MSDAKLWIDEVGCTATITGTNVSYTMPLWVFNVMRDIIGAEAEKKVEVTHRDFDTQQGLLDRYKAENAKLREMLAEDNEELAKMWRVIDYLYSFAKACGVDAGDMRELGVEVD